MMNKRVLFSILAVFVILFILFMFSVLSVDLFSRSDDNLRDGAVSAITGETALTGAVFAIPETGEAVPSGIDVSANPVAVLITASAGEGRTFAEWCAYGKYRYRLYDVWPQGDAVADADVIIVGQMQYDADTLITLRQYARTGIPLVFTSLPAYEVLAADAGLADFFGIAACVDPAITVDGLKLFADFFLSKERIYTAGDFYGETDDTRVTLPYYTLRAGYDGYLVGLLDDQLARGIENEQLPTLLWRTYTGKSQLFVVNTGLFAGQRMLGILTAFLSKAGSWYLYPVVNARAILMTDYPFLSYENSETAQRLYSRDMPGFERDIVWPNVVKVFRNYGAPANFFVSPQLDYADGEGASADDLGLYWKLIKGQSGAIGLSLTQTSALPLREVAAQADSFFGAYVPSFRFYAAYAGRFSPEQWRAFLKENNAGILGELSLVVFPNSGEYPLFSFLDEQTLSVQMTADGFAHETTDDLQLLSLMTALGYSAQQADMTRALLPQDAADDWSNLSELWSKGDTFYRDFEALETASVYELETRVRRLLGANYTCSRSDDRLLITVSPLEEEQWFVLRLQGETVVSAIGGEAVRLSDTAWLLRVTQEHAEITLKKAYDLPNPQ